MLGIKFSRITHKILYIIIVVSLGWKIACKRSDEKQKFLQGKYRIFEIFSGFDKELEVLKNTFAVFFQLKITSRSELLVPILTYYQKERFHTYII